MVGLGEGSGGQYWWRKGGHDYLKGGTLLEVGLPLLCVCYGWMFYLLLVENVIRKHTLVGLNDGLMGRMPSTDVLNRF
jgi:hypothetical protein